MEAAIDNFSVHEGESFTRTWFFSGATDVTGLSAQVDFREKDNDDSTLYFSLSTTSGSLVLSNSSRTINGVVVPGIQMVVTIAPSVTSDQTFKKAHFDWKLMGPVAGFVRYPIDGVLTLKQRKTK
jgi:hypothetical protein